MTEVEYGGGPTVDQRSAFCALLDGARIPGYTGHVHQYRYKNGGTFGELTHQVAQARDCSLATAAKRTTAATDGLTPSLVNELPRPTGDNKLTDDMIPGYSGYIPRRLFKFSRRYKHECGVSIDEHLTDFKKTIKLESNLRDVVRSCPKFQPMNHDPEVRDHLNTFRDTHPLPPVLVEHKRGPLEPPKRSWMGVVPRFWTTDTGIGVNFREGSRRALDRFRYETDCHFDIVKLPVNVEWSPSCEPRADHPTCKRVYLKDGMIPMWTGLVPGRKWTFGQTYGNATRACDVCSHDDDQCYGAFVRRRQQNTY